MTVCVGFEPILPSKPVVMVLGTMPGRHSIDASFYYAHPRNAFWPILSSVFNVVLDGEQSKTTLCLQKQLLVWDVLKTCERKGSLDAKITWPGANDFECLLALNPSIKAILFNGKKAEDLFKKQVIKNQRISSHITYFSLPSTSPAYAAMSFNDKRLKWQAVLTQFL